MKSKINVRLVVLIAISAAIGFWRICLTDSSLSEWANFTPIGALALFGGTYFVQKSKAFIFPLLMLFLSDVILMQTVYAEHRSGLLYGGWAWTYVSFIIMVLIGILVNKKVSIGSFLISAFAAGFGHFLISNFGVWLGGGMNLATGLPYSRDVTGLTTCYVMAIPYFKSMLLGNLIYGAVFFGMFELLKAKYPVVFKVA